MTWFVKFSNVEKHSQSIPYFRHIGYVYSCGVCTIVVALLGGLNYIPNMHEKLYWNESELF